MNIFRYVFFALLTASLVACASSGQKHGMIGQYVSDSSTTTNVKAAIFQDPGLGATDIHVETNHDAVRLSGFVSSLEQVKKAEEIARTVNGVKTVNNNLTVKQ